MHVVICDDNSSDAKETCNFLFIYFQRNHLERPTVTTVSTGAKLLAQDNMDILFLDIELQDESGLSFIKTIRERFPHTPIVVVSAYPTYITESCSYNADQFLIKPLISKMFTLAMNQIMNKYRNTETYFIRQVAGSTIKIAHKKVLYMEYHTRQIVVTLTSGEKYSYSGTLRNEESLLKAHGFIRCHKSYIVNLKYVTHVVPFKLQLTSPKGENVPIPIGRSMYEPIHKAFFQNLINR